MEGAFGLRGQRSLKGRKWGFDSLPLHQLEHEMRKPKNYYKVVCKTKRGGFFSAIVDDPSVRVSYRMDRWSTPKVRNSKVFCYDKLRDAVRFWSNHELKGPMRIFKCEARNPEVTSW